MVRETGQHHLLSQDQSTVFVVQTERRDYSKQVLHQKGKSQYFVGERGGGGGGGVFGLQEYAWITICKTKEKDVTFIIS